MSNTRPRPRGPSRAPLDRSYLPDGVDDNCSVGTNLVAEMAFFYLAPVLTGAADICVAGGFDCVIAAHRGELKPLGRGARPPA
jgi:hypothetical protein